MSIGIIIKSNLTVTAIAFLFQTAAIAQIHVKAPGNVGIGVANPDFKLQVNGHTEIGDQNAHDPTRYGTLQLIRPGNPGDDKFHLSFVRAGNAITGIGYAGNSNNFGIWVSPPQGTISAPTIGITPNGNVGIGTSAPADKLHVMGNLRLSAGNEIFLADNGQIRSFDDNHRILFRREDNIMEFREYGNIVFSSGSGVGQETAYMVVGSNGNVGIGIGTSATSFKLHVAGDVKANSYYSNADHYPDYVFDSTYQLPSLREVAAYIKENHHLPEVPSEAEVKRDGLNLSSHQVILLKKIEELTLYAIEQNEKQKLLEEKLNEVLNTNNKLKVEIEGLKKKAKASR
jgi:hypothetical protein